MKAGESFGASLTNPNALGYEPLPGCFGVAVRGSINASYNGVPQAGEVQAKAFFFSFK